MSRALTSAAPSPAHRRGSLPPSRLDRSEAAGARNRVDSSPFPWECRGKFINISSLEKPNKRELFAFVDFLIIFIESPEYV